MGLTQDQPLASPAQYRPDWADFFAVLQNNLLKLHEAAHLHGIRTSAPASSDGQIGDIILVDVSGTCSLYVKFPSGWKSASFI